MEQEYYTEEEIVILREQLRKANAEALKLWSDVTIHPRIAEALKKK